MASWIVSGAGNAGYDGTYLETGVYGGKPAYTNGTKWLFWAYYAYVSANCWNLASVLGAPDPGGYHALDADLPGTWEVNPGSVAPAPTVTAEGSGGGHGFFAGTGWFEILTPADAATIAPGTIRVTWRAVQTELPDGFVEPEASAVEGLLWGFPVYDDGYTPMASGPFSFYGLLHFNVMEGWWEVSGSVPIPVVAGHGATCDMHLNFQGIVTDVASAVWSFATGDVNTEITITGEPVGGAPTVVITSPANGATVGGTEPIVMSATDDKGLVSIALAIDGVTVKTQPVSGLAAAWTYQWDTTLETNGLHYLTATATDSDALTGFCTIVVTVYNEPPSGDVEDPVVEITEPVAGEASGEIAVRATISDNVGVVRAECFLDGISQGELLAPNETTVWRWTVDLREFANGGRDVVVQAWDAAGNMGYDTVTVTVANSLANATWYIYTEQASAVGFPGRVRSGRDCGLGLGTLMVETPPENPALRLNVFLAVDDGEGTPDFETMQPIEHMRAHGYLGAAETFRFGIKGVPQQVLASWLTGVVSAIRVREWPQGLLLLSQGSVLAFDGLTVEEWRDLTTLGTGLDMAWWNGKVAVALGAVGLALLDPDSGETDWIMDCPEGSVSVDVVEAWGTDLMIGAGADAANGALWRLSGEYDLVKVQDIERVSALAACGATLGIGCVGGKVYSYNRSVVNLALATGETNVTRLALLGSIVLAGTGDGGAVYRSLPAWAADGAFGETTEVRALAVLNGRIYAGGDREVIWYRIGDEDWGQAGVVDALEINDMVVWNDGLYMVTTGASEGKLWRLEVAPDGEIVSGTRKPCFTYEVLRRQ